MLRDAQEIIRRHGVGEKVRAIARELRLSRNTVARVIDEFKAAQKVSGDTDLAAEAAALVAKYSTDGGMHCEHESCGEQRHPCTGPHPVTAEDVRQLNDLEFWRLPQLPDGHPARVAAHEMHVAGWQRTHWSDRVEEWTVEWVSPDGVVWRDQAMASDSQPFVESVVVRRTRRRRSDECANQRRIR